MPTNDERREVAGKLHELTAYVYDTASVFELIGYAIGETAERLDRLADLIEPEPEDRTCRNVGGDGWGFKCSECGCHSETWFETPHGDKWTEAPGYYPNCGAKVVE